MQRFIRCVISHQVNRINSKRIGTYGFLWLLFLAACSPTSATTGLPTNPSVSAPLTVAVAPFQVPTSQPTIPPPVASPQWTATRLVVSTVTPCTAPASWPKEMVYICSDLFIIGSVNGRPDEMPPHVVKLASFGIDINLVTWGWYQQCVSSQQCHVVPRPRESWETDNYPVTSITWDDAKIFCEWVGKRLPTEAEWEAAAHGSTPRLWPWGDIWDSSKANTAEAGIGRSTPIGSYPSGASPYGILDMAGNVAEWVADAYSTNYSGLSTPVDPRVPDLSPNQQARVVRGGSYSLLSDAARTSARSKWHPASGSRDIGFRCARSGE